MKLLVTCDDVFDMLTRGPFPSGDADDAAVELHLACCHECRELAEALRPAVELVHEAVAAERDDLPRYEGVGTVCAQEGIAVRPSVQLRRMLAAEDHPRFAWWSQLSAAVAILIALGVLFWSAAPSGSSSKVPNLISAQALGAGHQPDEQGRLHLSALNLPKICLVSAPSAASRDVTAALQCCTRCHHAESSAARTTLAVASLQQSCVACHKS